MKSLPSPNVRRENEMITIIIPRFYTESGFAERNPKNLTLFTNFIPSVIHSLIGKPNPLGKKDLQINSFNQSYPWSWQ